MSRQPQEDGDLPGTRLALSGSDSALPGSKLSAWHESRRRRAMDCCVAGLAVGMLSPALVLIAVLVRLSSPGPAIFRQTRVGMHGLDFTILKFRTMRCGAEGSQRSAADAHRITPLGRMLRRYKLDELPQLLHVVTGKMSLVGPRPKLREHHSTEWHMRPGITGAASVAFAAEEALLCDIPVDQLEVLHREIITPHKIALDLHYAENATFRSDLRLLAKTLLRSGRYTNLADVPGHPILMPAAAPRPEAVPSRNRTSAALRPDTGSLWTLGSDSADAAHRARKISGEAW